MAKVMIRQGGRSARIQEAVHKAVRELLGEIDRTEISVPMLAERAGVTPSTIYRRWGDLSEVLADVASERMRPQTEPADTGSALGDVEAWARQYAEEMATPVGRQMYADLFTRSGESAYSCRCCEYTRQQLEILQARALARGEAGFDIGEVEDRVLAPIVYHLLMGDRDVTPDYCTDLVGAVTSLPRP
ncbi:TetR/AcrR family transcriptional regulator [Rhizobium halophytocola]|uniref:AcrR family transcriptional regulator n=1 Tax=Rhizobium halophytocola TaxID=735519 RepID=A0ABS4DW18_9HYPH|nr:AcrR family transcriptional regulator [Rhizobium halophytocola]